MPRKTIFVLKINTTIILKHIINAMELLNLFKNAPDPINSEHLVCPYLDPVCAHEFFDIFVTFRFLLLAKDAKGTEDLRQR
jgi:hypothetical protein